MGSSSLHPSRWVLALLVGLGPLAVATGAPLLPDRASAAAAVVELVVPPAATLGDVVQVAASGGGPGATYDWDLDGDGVFEVLGSTDPVRAFGFAQAGQRPIGVRVNDADGTSTTRTSTLQVRRPTTAKVVLDPPNPKPGQSVKATVVSRTDDPEGIAAYVWDLEGVDARQGSTTITKPGAGLVGTVLDAGAGLDVTRDPSLRFTMPGGRSNLGRSVDLTVSVIDASGGLTTVDRSVILDTPAGGLQTDPYQGKVVDCDDPKASKVPAWPCAAMTYSGMAVTGVGIPFQDTTPTVEVCFPEVTTPAGGGTPRLEVTELKNLGYPSPEAIAIVGDVVSTPGFRGAERGARAGAAGSSAERPASRVDTKEKCVDKGGLTQKWEWGDGTSTSGGIGESGKGFVYTHVYDTPGTYTVRLTTKVPYVLATKGGKTGSGKNSAIALKYFTATRTQQVEVGESRCAPVLLHSIPVSVGQQKSIPGNPPGCFGVRTSADGTHDVYLPAGPLLLNGIPVTSTGSAPIVDPTTATISAVAGTLSADLGAFEGGGFGKKRQVVAPTPVIAVPAPVQDDQAGGPYAALPAVPLDPAAPGNTVKGLGITAVQALLSPTGKPLTRLYTKLPAPLSGETAPLVVTDTLPQGRYAPEPAARGAIPGVDTDFEVDLSGIDLGAFRIVKGALGHRTSGGWVGSVDQLDVAGLGSFEAPYLPPGGAGDRCANVTGPSGIELTDGGAFVSGGVKADFSESPLPLGPLGLTCLALKGSATPFTMSGLATAQFPVSPGLVQVDACLAMAVLRTGDQGEGCSKAYTAPQDVVWFRATGAISLKDVVTLGTGEVDLVVGSGYQAATVRGEVGIKKSIFSGSAFVDGQMVFSPDFAYSLIGGITLCADLFIDICGEAQAGVSSKGYGACISIGGAVYLKASGWKVFFASCDLKSYLAVARTVEQRRAGTSAVATMPAGTSKAAFVVHRVGAGAPPTLRLTGPDGSVVTDDGHSSQELPDGTTIVKFAEEGVTTITVQGPAAGQWTVDAQPELVGCSPRGGCTYTTPDIDLDLQTPIPEPEVTGQVVGTGAQRTLQYAADLDPGDRLVLAEDGALGTRLLGTVPADGSSFAIPAAGPAGQRTVTAIIERNGIPYREITLGSYQAPSAVGLTVPAGLEVVTGDQGATATWQPVPGAQRYEVVADLGDGRRLRRVVTGTSAVVPGVTRFTPGTVRVRALGEVGLDSDVRSTALSPLTKVRVRW